MNQTRNQMESARYPKPFWVALSILLLGSLAWASDDLQIVDGMTHRMMQLALQLGVILFAAKLGSLVLRRLNLPGVVGELIAGVIIGPYLLGSIPIPGFAEGLFPIYSVEFPISPELYGICTLASIVLLFITGLETDVKLFQRYSIAGSLVGIGGVVVSFVLGDLAVVVFSEALFGVKMNFWSAPSLFLGIISTATSVGISARILSEHRQLESPEGVTILAGAVIDDVLGIVLLAIGMGIITASRESGVVDWGHIGIIALKAVGIWLAATVIGLIASHKIGTLLKWFKDRSSITVMAFGLALILAGLFEEVGLAMIIGAYVMGLALSKTDINHVIREKLNPVSALLVPVFFAVMGMLVNVRLLLSREVILFGIFFTVLADLAKIAGCGVPALFSNFNLLGALRVGFGMLPRGEVTLIIAGIGISAGVLNAEIFGVVVLMVLITALVAPPVLVTLIQRPGRGIRKLREAYQPTQLSFRFPSAETAQLLLRKLLDQFDSEGFFVHSISRRESQYQLRKEESIIGLQQRQEEIIFDCSDAEIPIIHTAMYEVLAELEYIINELKKPVDGIEIAKKIQEYVPGSIPGNKLANYLSEKVLVPDLKGNSKIEIIDELLEVLNREELVKDLAAARDAVLKREESLSTAMQFGIAIPHGRTNAVRHLVSAIGLKPEGLDFQSIDGEPTRIIVLTLSPRDASAPHMQFMSMVSQKLNSEGREALLACKTARQMYRVLTDGRSARKGALRRTKSKNR